MMLIGCVVLALGWVGGAQAGNGNCGGLLNVIAGLPEEPVDSSELTDLLFMREEEKLARDVYQAMNDLWGMRIFAQISWSEQNHMDALLALLQKYEIADPVGSNPPGVFSDPALQSLFDQLLDQGSQSLIGALSVGALIEDLDIDDLDGALARADNLDLRTAYQNLQKGSRNHLRSFVSVLARNGETYAPQYLTLVDFEEIISSPMEHGLLDANGDPVECTGGGSGSGQGPGKHKRHQHQHQNQEFGTNTGLAGR
jgi:hypothetical protein